MSAVYVKPRVFAGQKKMASTGAISVEAISRRKRQLGASLIALKKFYPLHRRASN
jgi:hypothetical protein